MSDHCQHEQELGQLKSDVHTLFKVVAELKQDTSSIKEQNISIIKLNINLEHLIAEVKENNIKFYSMLTDHDTRLNIMERAEGEDLKAQKDKIKEHTNTYVILAILGWLFGFLLH